MKIKLGVIFGGKSVEHEISIITAMQAIAALDNTKYDVIPIYIGKDNKWYTGEKLVNIEVFENFDYIINNAYEVVLKEKNNEYVLQEEGLFRKTISKIDLVFPIVHGTNVEDGVLQGYLETLGIPYVGSSVYASVAGQDKIIMKHLWEASDLPIPKYTWFYDEDFYTNEKDILKEVSKLKYPVIIKPSNTGSSVGIKICRDEKSFIEGVELAINYSNKIIVEEVIPNLKEVNIAVLGNYEYQIVSELDEMKPKSDFLTYEDKYINGNKKSGSKGSYLSSGKGGDSRIIPANLTAKMKEEIETIAKKAFKVLDASGNSRIDFLIDEKSKKVYINEINLIPGSLSFYLWEAKGMKYKELLDEIIALGIKDYKKRANKTVSFDTNVLSNFSNNSFKFDNKLK